MTTRKTKVAAPAPSKRPAAKKPTTSAAKSKATPDVFCLHLGTGFSLLTKRVTGGAVTVERVPAGAALEVSYWKSPALKATPEAKVTRITLHGRVDGVALPSLVVASRDGGDELVRLSPVLALPAEGKLLEFWFELETDVGETLWDSNWGHNHWLELTPGAAMATGSDGARAEA